MKVLTVSIALGPLMRLGALPAAPGQSARALPFNWLPARIRRPTGTPTLRSRGSNCRNGNERRTTSARKRKPKGKEGRHAGKNALNEAWTAAEAGSR